MFKLYWASCMNSRGFLPLPHRLVLPMGNYHMQVILNRTTCGLDFPGLHCPAPVISAALPVSP